ncbi:MAG: TolC family protein [Bryobacteraceae bacterium]|nr:TolC family protein [Bryobacteraceae bacterium]
MIRLLPALLLLALPLAAQNSLSLSSAVRRALDTHPALEAARERVEAARGQRRQAGLYPNPELVLQTENLRRGSPAAPFSFWNQTETFAYLQQTFLTAGKRARRLGVTEKGVRIAEFEYEIQRRFIALEVKRAYWRAAGEQKISELLRENEQNFRKIVDYHRARVQEGVMAEGDLLRVSLEADRFDLAANLAQLEASRARIEFFRALAETAFPEASFTDPLDPKDDRLLLPDPNHAVMNRPEVTLARLRLDQARAQTALEQANIRPDFEAYFGYKRAERFHTMTGGITIPLPVLNRNQGNLQTAAAQARAAEAELAATEALVRAEVAAAGTEYLVRRKQVREFLARFRDQAQETSRIAQAAYRLGGADLLRLLDAERLRLEVEQLAWRALAEYRQSIVTLEFALGAQP